MSLAFRLAGPFLQSFPPETAHALTLTALAWGLAPRDRRADPPMLAVKTLGLEFRNPVGLAAGFDKDARVPNQVLALGFGFVETGTVTPRPQPGNPRPRIFRLEADGAVINRLGFNSAGHERAVQRLAARRRKGVVGVNLGANKDTADPVADYVCGFAKLAPLADYVAINISSPNTPGLRGLQSRAPLERLCAALAEARRGLGGGTPILLKIAPDLAPGALEDILAVAFDHGLDGLIVSNTTVERPPTLKSPHAQETGGLSGKPLFAPSTALLAQAAKLAQGKLVLIGVGGVASGADAYAKIRAGATLVQLYTALTYQGPALIGRIKRELVALLMRDGFKHVTEAVGADL